MDGIKDMMKYYISFGMNIVNFVLHLLGIFLLWKTYNWRQITSQQLFIFHISISNCTPNFILILFRLIYLMVNNRQLMFYAFCVHFAFLRVRYLLMVFLTLDRLIGVILNFKYRVYWSVERTKSLLTIVWILGASFVVSYVLLYWKCGKWYQSDEYFVVNATFAFFFLFLALLTYSFIFLQYRKSNDLRNNTIRASRGGGSGTINNSVTFLVFKNRFYISLLIVFTYLVFNIIPICVAFLLIKEYDDTYNYSLLINWMLVQLGTTADAAVYIFMQKVIRRQFLLITRSCFC